jgi:hypothetical protein
LEFRDQVVKWLGEIYHTPVVANGTKIDWRQCEVLVKHQLKEKKVREICPDGEFPYPVVVFAFLKRIWEQPPYGSTELQLLCNVVLGSFANREMQRNLCEVLPKLVQVIAPKMFEMTFWSLFKIALVTETPWAQYNPTTQCFRVVHQNLMSDHISDRAGFLPEFPSTELTFPQANSREEYPKTDHPTTSYVKAFIGDAADYLVIHSSKSCRFKENQFILDL